MSRRLSAFPLLVAMVLLTAGCVQPEVTPSPLVTATDAPLFASEEEALAAATEAYAAYQKALDEAFLSYDTSPIATVASGDALSLAVESVETNLARGLVQTGSSSISDVRSVDPARLRTVLPNEAAEIYACLDVSQIDVLDRNGESIVPFDRPTLYPILASVSRIDDQLLVSSEETWEGEDFCE